MSDLAVSETTDATERRRLFTTFAYLISKQGATAVLGLAYWALATHLFRARDVGLAAAAASMAAVLAAIGVLGIAVLLLAEIGSIKETTQRAVVTTGLAIACSVVLLLSLGTLALSPILGKSLRIIAHDPITATLFVGGSVATVAAITFDNAAIGLHRGSAQLTRGILASILKLACVGFLVLAGTRTGTGLLLSWVAGLVVSLVVCIPMLRLKAAPNGEGGLSNRIALVRRYGMLSLNHHVLNLSINSVSFIVPAVAALLILPQQVAYFITADVLATTVLIIPYLLTLALFAARSDDPYLFHRQIRRTLPLGLAACGAIVIAVELAAPLILQFFGPAYAAHGSTVLRLLILIGPSYVIKDHYVAIRRAQGRLRDAAKIIALGTAAEAVGAAVGGAFWGVTGLSLGWAIAAACEALVLSPAVIQAFRRPLVAESDRGDPPQ